jgi:hypothetical protein
MRGRKADEDVAIRRGSAVYGEMGVIDGVE